MIAYVKLYYKIIGKKETYYARFESDFGKPLTRLRLCRIKHSVKRVFEKYEKIYHIELCSEEEYEQNHDSKETLIHFMWDSKGWKLSERPDTETKGICR